MKLKLLFVVIIAVLAACDPYYKNDYHDNTPTSGKLKVYYDEGLHLQIANQVYTFESQYPRVSVELYNTSDDEAVNALYNDSCESIVISRLLNSRENEAFESKQYTPKYLHVAVSGVAMIVATISPVYTLQASDVVSLLKHGNIQERQEDRYNVVFDRSNSSVVHYVKDSILLGQSPGSHCSAAASTTACIDYVVNNPGVIGFIDFAWLSDRDDSLYKKYGEKLRFVGIGVNGKVSYPSQSSFKTGEYPYRRNVYLVRKTGEFTLAKGFEGFVAGPKGQLTFLKQGLLPARQAERQVEVNFEPVGPVTE